MLVREEYEQIIDFFESIIISIKDLLKIEKIAEAITKSEKEPYYLSNNVLNEEQIEIALYHYYKKCFLWFLDELDEVRLDLTNRYELYKAEIAALLTDKQITDLHQLDKKYIRKWQRNGYVCDEDFTKSNLEEFFNWLKSIQ